MTHGIICLKKKIMTKRKKTFLFSASLLVFIFLSCFVAGQVQTSINKNIFGDSDQDGLSDEEERSYGTDSTNPDSDGDGYSDGVEVKSGYDPLKAAPGDRIISSNTEESLSSVADKSLTENFSATVSEFFAAKETSQEEISTDEINDLVSSNLSDKIGPAITFDTLPKLDRSQLNIQSQNYKNLSDKERSEKLKEDNDKYVRDILYLLFSNLPQTISSAADFESFKSTFADKLSGLSSDSPDYDYFRNLASSLDTACKQATSIEVPESLVDLHIKLIQLVNGYLALRDPSLPGVEDSVTRIIIMSRARMLIELTHTFFQEADQSLGLTE